MKLFIGAKALISHEGKVLVLREATYDEGTNEGKWDIPGGRIEAEEPILEGLSREIHEETGLNVEVGEVVGVFETFPTIKGEACHIVRIFYTAQSTSSEVRLSGDHDQYEWIDPSNLDDREYVSSLRELLGKVAKK